MPLEWNLGYEHYLIADGEPERDVGDVFEWFAVEFWVHAQLALTNDHIRSAMPLADYLYSVVAEVTFISEKASVIDFGLKAIRTRDLLPPVCREGDFVTGEIGIGLPLSTEIVPEGVQAGLKHTWRVNRISADMTQYIEIMASPRPFLVRDQSRIHYEEANSTRSVRAPRYILHCSEVL